MGNILINGIKIVEFDFRGGSPARTRTWVQRARTADDGPLHHGAIHELNHVRTDCGQED